MKKKMISIIACISLLIFNLSFSVGFASETDVKAGRDELSIQERNFKDLFDKKSSISLNENKDNVKMILMHKETEEWKTTISASDICDRWSDLDEIRFEKSYQINSHINSDNTITLNASSELYHTGDTAVITVTDVSTDETIEVPVNFTEVQKPTFATWEQAAQYINFIDRSNGDSSDVFVDSSLSVDLRLPQNTIDTFDQNREDRQSVSFTDVKDTDWFYDSVQYICENGLMNGTGDGAFSPDGITTRGMIVMILYRMENSPAVDSDVTFTDVSAGRYYADAVAWANENDIVNGYGSGAFGPDDPITREQMASVLYRYAQLKGYDIAASGNLARFSDDREVSPYAANPMRWAVGNSLISGMGDNMLAPGESSTRAQTAAILTRFCENIIPPEPFEPVRPSGSVAYENRDLGFRIEFSDTWENRYRVEANPNNPSSIMVETEWGGILCFIFKNTKEQWEEAEKNDWMTTEYRVLGESGEYIYLMYFASDAPYDPEDEEQTRIYREMREDLYHIGFEIL